jgi:DNA-binding PadR family transcriptional regulator
VSVFGHGRFRLYILKLLAEGPRHGYEIIKALEERFEGLYTPSAGTVYPRLARLEADGLVTRSDEEGERKIYRITPAGRAELRRRETDLDDLEDDIAGTIRSLGKEVRAAVGASAASLKSELRAAVGEIKRQSKERRAETERAVGEVEHLARRFRSDLRDLARRSAPTRDDVARIERVLAAAFIEVRRILDR